MQNSMLLGEWNATGKKIKMEDVKGIRKGVRKGRKKRKFLVYELYAQQFFFVSLWSKKTQCIYYVCIWSCKNKQTQNTKSDGSEKKVHIWRVFAKYSIIFCCKIYLYNCPWTKKNNMRKYPFRLHLLNKSTYYFTHFPSTQFRFQINKIFLWYNIYKGRGESLSSSVCCSLIVIGSNFCFHCTGSGEYPTCFSPDPAQRREKNRILIRP